jgi:hypothetical protein
VLALWAPEDFNRQEILVDIPGPQRRYSESWTMHELRRACMVIRAAANADCTPYYDLRRRAEQQVKLVALLRFEPTRLRPHTFGRVCLTRGNSARGSRVPPRGTAILTRSGSNRHGSPTAHGEVQSNNLAKSAPITRPNARSVGEFLVSLAFAGLRNGLRKLLI